MCQGRYRFAWEGDPRQGAMWVIQTTRILEYALPCVVFFSGPAEPRGRSSFQVGAYAYQRTLMQVPRDNEVLVTEGVIDNDLT